MTEPVRAPEPVVVLREIVTELFASVSVVPSEYWPAIVILNVVPDV